MGRLGEIDAALERTDLSPRAQLTLLHLLNLPTNADGQRFPSVGTLAGRMGCGETVTRGALQELAAAGAVAVAERYVDGRQTSNGYVVTLDGPSESRTPGGSESRSHGGSESRRPGVNREESAGRSNPPGPPQAGGVENPSRCERHRRQRRGCPDCELPPLAPVPEHCGNCDPNRWLVDDHGLPVRKCPDCHPSVVRPA